MPPTKKKVGLRELRVGLFVVIAIGILIFLILSAAGDLTPFTPKLRLRAQFANADGLRGGSEVRLAGVRVGTVKDVRLLPPSDDPNAPKIEALMEVESVIDGRPAAERIRSDSVATLGSPSILGTDKLINITPGTALGQPIKDGDLLRSSSANTLADVTASSNELVQQLNQLSRQVTEIAQKINEGQGTFGRFLNDESFYNNLNAAVRDLQDLTRRLRSGEGTAGQLINDPTLYNNLATVTAELQTISADLRRGRGTAGKLLTDEALYNEARTAVARLNRSADEINAIVADVRAGRGTVGKLLTDEAFYNDARFAIARLNATTARIDEMIASAQRGEGTVGKLLTDDQLYTNVNQLSSEAVKLIYDFRRDPGKYLRIKVSLF